jgi:hypothetical protein
MSLGQLLILHLMAGAGVAATVFLATPNQRLSMRCFQVATALLFWPMYLPLLLQKQAAAIRPVEPSPPTGGDVDQTIAQVNEDLDAALASLERKFGNTFAQQDCRLRNLRLAWARQAGRIREMEQLLKHMECPAPAAALACASGDERNDRLRDSREALEANIRRLGQTKQDQFADLLGTLTEARELVSLIHLLVYATEAASQKQLAAQFIAAVEAFAARNPANEDEPMLSPPAARRDLDSICLVRERGPAPSPNENA